MKYPKFNFLHIQKHYPLAWNELSKWAAAAEYYHNLPFVMVGDVGTRLPVGFYWLMDFFDEYAVYIKSYPAENNKELFIYYVTSSHATSTSEVAGNRRACLAEAFLGGFMHLEKILMPNAATPTKKVKINHQ